MGEAAPAAVAARLASRLPLPSIAKVRSFSRHEFRKMFPKAVPGYAGDEGLARYSGSTILFCYHADNPETAVAVAGIVGRSRIAKCGATMIVRVFPRTAPKHPPV